MSLFKGETKCRRTIRQQIFTISIEASLNLGEYKQACNPALFATELRNLFARSRLLLTLYQEILGHCIPKNTKIHTHASSVGKKRGDHSL